jgi:hypothetical protein
MAAQVTCGFPIFCDGMTWSGLLGRQYDGGTAVIDSGASSAAVTPAGGVYQALAANLKVTAPVSGMTVNIAPGYCMVPSATAHAGGYRFGLMSSGSLTVAANATGQTRQDYVLATVSDVASSSSVAEVQYVTGTTSPPSVPASSIILAQVAVPNGASNIVSGDITDKRTFVCAPGGILHLPSAAAAIAATATQFFWRADTSTLVQGSGTAGSVTAYTKVPAGAVEYDPGESGFPALEFEADGMTDFEIYYAREPSSGGFSEQVYLELFIDYSRVDTTWTLDGSVILGRVSATYYTSSGRGTTPSAGTHVARLGGTASEAAHTLRVSPVIL